MTKSKKNKNTAKIKILGVFLLVFAGLILVAGGFLLYRNYQKSLPPEIRVIASVGGEKIYQKDLNELIYSMDYNNTDLNRFGKDAKKIETSLLDTLIEQKILDIKAKELGITLSDEEILNQARAELREFDQYDTTRQVITKEAAKAKLLKDKISEKVLTWRSGKFILIRADVNFHTLPTNLSFDERSKLIPEDLKYAQDLVNSIYNKVKNGEIAFEKGMEMANNDPRLGISAWKGWKMTFSQAFTKEDSLLKPYPASAPNFWEEVDKINVGELSQPIILKVTLGEDSPAGKKDQLVDGLYLIVKSDQGNNGEATSYNEWLLKAKSEVGVKKTCF